jgi:hypothetical protein
MIIQQKVFLQVIPKWNRADAGGQVPVYIRIKIDGYEDAEVSLGC